MAVSPPEKTIEIWGGDQMPILTAGFDDFFARKHVENRFENAQEYADRTKEIALEMMRNLGNRAEIPGFDIEDREFQFDLQPPDISNLTVPDPPQDINIPTFSGEFPKIDDLAPPAAVELEADVSFPDDVLDRLKQEFFDGLKAPEGYSPDVERGIYDRARSRREADMRQKKNAAYDEFAKRGFEAPPGALLSLIKQYDIEDHREEADLNRDIVKEQADLVRQKYEFLLQTGLNIDSHVLERGRHRAQTSLEKSRLQMQFALDVFSTKLRKAEVQSSLLQSEVQLYAEQARMEALKFDAYRAQIQGVQSKAELERIKTQIFSEQRQAKADTYRLQLEQDRLNLDAAIRKQEHQRSIAEQAANIAAQLAASAMTAVSASASLSGSQGESASKSYSASVGRSDGVYYSYTGSSE